MGEAFVLSLVKSAISNGQGLSVHSYMDRELAKDNRRGVISSQPSRNDSVNMYTSYSGEDKEQLSLVRWNSRVGLAIASRFSEAPRAKVNVLLSRLAVKAK